MFMVSLTYILNNKTDMFGLSTKTFLGIESVLMAVKIVSFTSTARTLLHKQKEEKENEIKPKESIVSIKKMFYFRFSPTFIYSSNYPLTDKTNWSRVFFYTYFNITIFMIGIPVVYGSCYPLQMAGRESIPISILIKQFVYLSTITSGYLCLFMSIGCYNNLTNLWAEILWFADRGFYKDYWTSYDWSNWFSKWNKIMKNYLIISIYKPVKQMIGDDKSRIPAFVTMTLSGFLFHDLIGILIFGFMYFPPFFVLQPLSFLVPTVSLDNKHPSLSHYVFFVSTLIICFSLLLFTFLLEFYCRKNCLFEQNWTNFFLPVSLSCLEVDYSR